MPQQRRVASWEIERYRDNFESNRGTSRVAVETLSRTAYHEHMSWGRRYHKRLRDVAMTLSQTTGDRELPQRR